MIIAARRFRWSAAVPLIVAAGCSAPDASRAESGGTAAPGPRVAAGTSQELEREYLVGPAACRRLGQRIVWQATCDPHGSSGIRQISAQHDSVFVLDGLNFLARLHATDGSQLWRIPVADPSDVIHGITYVANLDRIYLTAGGAVYVLDADTGSQVQRQKLEQIASTAPVVHGPFFIYGSRNGQLVWHSYEVGYLWKSYRIAASIHLPPLLAGDEVVAVGSSGRIMALDASAAMGLWSKDLLDGVVARPVAGDAMVYVAGLDHHVWAFDLATGRRVWRYLSESPLRDQPVLIADRLYQQIPTEGLVCFEAVPQDAPGGVVVWRSRDVKGTVIGAYGPDLLVWDAEARRLALLDALHGGVRETADVPGVRHLLATATESGDLVAAGDDGRVIRLVPRR